MSDYKGIFAADFFDNSSEKMSERSEAEYSVKVVDRQTLAVAWEGSVYAFSKKGAQANWRKDYSHIRAQYSHAYALLIKRNDESEY
jgi:hypothetical protein